MFPDKGIQPPLTSPWKRNGIWIRFVSSGVYFCTATVGEHRKAVKYKGQYLAQHKSRLGQEIGNYLIACKCESFKGNGNDCADKHSGYTVLNVSPQKMLSGETRLLRSLPQPPAAVPGDSAHNILQAPAVLKTQIILHGAGALQEAYPAVYGWTSCNSKTPFQPLNSITVCVQRCRTASANVRYTVKKSPCSPRFNACYSLRTCTTSERTPLHGCEIKGTGIWQRCITSQVGEKAIVDAVQDNAPDSADARHDAHNDVDNSHQQREPLPAQQRPQHSIRSSNKLVLYTRCV